MDTNQQTATLRYLRVAPRKVRAVAGLLRGLSVNEAEAQLLVQRRRPAGILLKLLRSCVANAKQTNKLDIEKLYIASIRVDGGPMLHRSLPRARGSADPIQKKSSHVTIVLQERENNMPSRFLIQARTKKKPSGDGEKKTKRVPKIEETQKEKEKKPGFFRKMFSRKSI